MIFDDISIIFVMAFTGSLETLKQSYFRATLLLIPIIPQTVNKAEHNKTSSSKPYTVCHSLQGDMNHASFAWQILSHSMTTYIVHSG